MFARFSSAGLLLAALGAGPAEAQTYPARTITIVVPVAPGGVSDTFARGLANEITQRWGKPVVVENRAGAEHVIGAASVAKADPDGYTLLLTEGTAMIPSLYGKLPYDPATDFVPISGLIGIFQSLVVHPSLPVKSLRELIEYGKAKPGGLSFGSFGAGGRLGMEMLRRATGMQLVMVQYRGSTPMIADLVAGHVDLSTVNVGAALGLAKDDKLRMLGVTSRQRLPQLPDVPAIAEVVPGFETAYWFGLFAPAGTSPDIAQKLNSEVQRIIMDKAFAERFVDRQLFQPLRGTPSEFAAYIKADADKWGQVARNIDRSNDAR